MSARYKMLTKIALNLFSTIFLISSCSIFKTVDNQESTQIKLSPSLTVPNTFKQDNDYPIPKLNIRSNQKHNDISIIPPTVTVKK